MSDHPLDVLSRAVLERTMVLASIPSPSGLEGARAALVSRWWQEDGWSQVEEDATGNVWALARAGGAASIVVCAHLDTVFPTDASHDIREESGQLLGPSVGDDSVAVAALSAVGQLIKGTSGPSVWLLATVGEEGLGNLRGIRDALASFPGRPIALIAVEGNYFGRVSVTAVGSLRWRVVVRGPGGHAWEASNSPSAIHAAAAMVARLDAVGVAGAKTTVNAGLIRGGEAINARARECWFDLDLRADEPTALDLLETRARETLEREAGRDLQCEVIELGRRPAGRIDTQHPLVRAAASALEDAGTTPTFAATSTDANAAHARGIPAIAVGITTGGGEHTLQEWIDTEPVGTGLSVLAATIRAYGEAGDG